MKPIVSGVLALMSSSLLYGAANPFEGCKLSPLIGELKVTMPFEANEYREYVKDSSALWILNRSRTRTSDNNKVTFIDAHTNTSIATKTEYLIGVHGKIESIHYYTKENAAPEWTPQTYPRISDTYIYDNNGNLIQNEYRSTYAPSLNTTEITHTYSYVDTKIESTTTQSSNHIRGRITESRRSIQTGKIFALPDTFSYEEQHVVQTSTSTTTTKTRCTNQLTYNGDNRVTRLVQKNVSEKVQNRATTYDTAFYYYEYVYENRKLVKETLSYALNTDSAVEVHDSYSYEYTPAGLLHRMTHGNDSSCTYVYDNQNRLIEELVSVRNAPVLKKEFLYNPVSVGDCVQGKSSQKLAITSVGTVGFSAIPLVIQSPSSGILTISLFNAKGVELLQQKIECRCGENRIELSTKNHLAKGVYYLATSMNTNRQGLKIIVE